MIFTRHIKRFIIIFALLSTLTFVAVNVGKSQPRNDWDVIALETLVGRNIQVYLYDLPRRISFQPFKIYVKSDSPAWSPDGQKLFYRAVVESSPHFYLLDLSTYELTQGPYGGNVQTFWTNNHEILYVRQETPPPDNLPMAAGAWKYQPLSPDKTKLAGGDVGGITIVDTEKGELIPVMNRGCRPSYFAWSPDSKRLAFVTCFEFYIYDVESATLTEYPELFNQSSYQFFQWASDSRHVVVELIDLLNKTQLVLLDVETQEMTTLLELHPFPARFDIRPVNR